MRTKTPRAKLYTIFNKQNSKSDYRGMDRPSYTFDELFEWARNHTNYMEMFDIWKNSDYDTKLAPSIDRLDDYKPYALDNIQIITWQENVDKGHRDRFNGINNKVSKAVNQYAKDGKFIASYESMQLAARALGKRCISIIAKCAKGQRKIAYGFKWKYIGQTPKELGLEG